MYEYVTWQKKGILNVSFCYTCTSLHVWDLSKGKNYISDLYSQS